MESDERDKECLDLDDLLPEVGEFGKYQKIMLWLVCLPACFPCGFGAFNQLFMSEIPDHWCYVPELQNFTVQERIYLAIPKTNQSHSKCQKYLVDWNEILDGFEDVFSIPINESWEIGNCNSGWEYNKTEVSSSIVIDFDLVCDKDIYPTLGLVALNLGGPLGVYCFGILNDRIGRKKSFFLCLTTLIFGGILTATAQNFWWWAGSRVIVGLTIPAIYQIPFIISLELVGPNYRSFVTVLTCMFYTFGLMLLSGVTYLIRDWVQLAYTTTIPFFLYYIYWFFLPESPRWLLARGKFVEASNILQTLARVNNKDLPESFTYKLKQRISRANASEESLYTKQPNIQSLCGTPNMRLKTCLITLNWFANETVYVGLSYYGPSLGDNQYLSFLLSCVVEIPSYFACWIIMDRWGRRWPLCLCMIISGVSCIATVLIPPEDHVTTLVLFLISKSAISASFLIIYPFAGELYPTQLRGIGIGTSAYIGGLGLIVIPFITYLGSEMLILPLIIMGILSVIGGLSGLRLPETLHYKLPQTAEEGEEFGKDFTVEDCCRCIPLRPEYPKSCSYEALELHTLKEDDETDLVRKVSIKRLARQSSVMDTPKDVDGTMKMTYWF
ncbi:carcinine transporter [Onthophagus taurus]|uniref:carcinine transporter n=1 Tax=Onthophagus taurus TaxID=166361 RepID=UPI000C1FFDF9|nr:carcinine transporter [Onthophagus taurus]